jgi:hypothetical protein
MFRLLLSPASGSKNPICRFPFSLFSTTWGICFSLEANLKRLKTSSFGTVVTHCVRLLSCALKNRKIFAATKSSRCFRRHHPNFDSPGDREIGGRSRRRRRASTATICVNLNLSRRAPVPRQGASRDWFCGASASVACRRGHRPGRQLEARVAFRLHRRAVRCPTPQTASRR